MDGNYILVGISGRALRLRNEDTQEVEICAVTDLPHRLATPPEFTTFGAAELHAFDKDENNQELVILEAHILEIIEAKPFRGDTIRPEYDPAMTTLSGRIATKSRELSQAADKEIKPRTLERHISNYRKLGRAGLVDKRKVRPTKPLGNADPRLIDAIAHVVSEERNLATGTGTRLIGRVKEELAKRHPGEEIKIPTEKTIAVYVKRLSQGMYPLDDAKLRRTATSAPRKMHNSRPPVRPGSECQIDSSPFNIVVLDRDGNPIRVVLTIIIDKATRSIIGVAVNPYATRGYDHALLLSRCFVPQELRPVPGFEEIDAPTMPWAASLTADRAAKLNVNQPFIVPERIVTDHGMDYLSAAFVSACKQFGVTITEASPKTPYDKGMVERAFRTIDVGFAQHLPGYKGNSVKNRGESPEKEPGLLDIYTLLTLSERWITIVWQNTFTEGLRDPYDPSIRLTPNMAYMSFFNLTDDFVPVPRTGDDYIRMLPITERKITTKGIQIGYRRYDSVKLNPYRDVPGPGGRGKLSYNVREDPSNPKAVWVEDHKNGGWIQCDWMDGDAFIKPFTRSMRRAADHLVNSNLGLSREQARDITRSVVLTMNPDTRKHARNEMDLELRNLQGISIPVHDNDAAPTPFTPAFDDSEDDELETYDASTPLTDRLGDFF
ncbi:DDE-type integrase/transposase/recombinase [Leifsonia shinshuensis]|uniref:Integrase catalytic domain-containing protein n=1 Tax=Leifsonia shinshuensis TaxID=150026 RepID=A0A853CYD1_9MICO|nr:DDE-type integrase/transposase/recombinase [Leifsonia shinshuensis]NYJ25597.1 hypothetical protein [Leifsonia shinshuensis]